MIHADERKFLHEVNNKLAIIDGRMNMLVRKMKKPDGLSEEEVLRRSEEIQKTIGELAELTVQRRDILLTMEEEAA